MLLQQMKGLRALYKNVLYYFLTLNDNKSDYQKGQINNEDQFDGRVPSQNVSWTRERLSKRGMTEMQ